MSLLDRFLARVAPINVGNSTLGALVRAITLPGEWLDVLVRDSDTHRAWGKALDPDYAPAVLLPWLAQFPGVRFLPSDTEAVRRSKIRSPAGFNSCKPQAMIDEVKPTLTGAQYVNLIQQAGGARWAMTLVTRPAETPDATATYTAALRQKAAGIGLTHVLTNDVLWVEGTKTWSAVLGAVTWANVTPADV